MIKSIIGAFAYGLALLAFLIFLAVVLVASPLDFSVVQLVLLFAMFFCISYFVYVALKLIGNLPKEAR